MGKTIQQLWDDVAENSEGPGAIQDLSKILADKEGRHFVLGLKDEQAKLCTDLSGRVSCDLHLPVAASYCSAGHHRNQPQPRPEAEFLRHIEKTR